jgi:hypothetical protein
MAKLLYNNTGTIINLRLRYVLFMYCDKMNVDPLVDAATHLLAPTERHWLLHGTHECVRGEKLQPQLQLSRL